MDFEPMNYALIFCNIDLENILVGQISTERVCKKTNKEKDGSVTW
jgi:hypothetical protein